MKALSFINNNICLVDIEAPERKSGESLIRVVYAGICNTDLEIIKGYMGFSGVLGHEFTGIVEESDRKELIGKRVVGEINLYCGDCPLCKDEKSNHCENRSVLGILNKNGCMTKYITMPDKHLRIIPDEINDLNAVFIEPLAAAIRPLDQFHYRKEQKVCVLGDGKLGILSAIVFNSIFDNTILMGKHQEKLNIANKYGIKTMLFSTDYNNYDIIIECTGKNGGILHAIKMIKPMGTIILKTTSADDININLSPIVINEINIIGSRCGNFQKAMEFLIHNKDSIDLQYLISGTFPLEKGIEAIDYSKKIDIIKVLLEL